MSDEYIPKTARPTSATPLMLQHIQAKLKNMLTEREFKAVAQAAARNQDQTQLPLIAWAMGFLSFAQLEDLLVGLD